MDNCCIRQGEALAVAWAIICMLCQKNCAFVINMQRCNSMQNQQLLPNTAVLLGNEKKKTRTINFGEKLIV